MHQKNIKIFFPDLGIFVRKEEKSKKEILKSKPCQKGRSKRRRETPLSVFEAFEVERCHKGPTAICYHFFLAFFAEIYHFTWSETIF